MIGKIRKGRSFGGCIRYVTQKDDAEIIASEGVLLGTAEEMARSFRWQCLLNPDVAKPVGHIALSFKPEDAPRLTDAFMARLAEEYLELMGIRNTQFIVVRHHGTDNPHCHKMCIRDSPRACNMSCGRSVCMPACRCHAGSAAVSYTHLDVYKRQRCALLTGWRGY